MMSTIPQVSEHTADGTAYDVTGPTDAPCVVLIHGLGLARGLWDMHLSAFAGFRVVRYDLYGHGQSSMAPETGSLALYAAQIVGLLDHLNIKTAHIVGFSIGGMINRRFALDFPERATSLVILNAPHDRGQIAQALVEDRARAARAQGAFATFDAALERWFTPAYLKEGEGPAHVRKWREQVDDESYAQTAWVLANGVVELIAPDPALTLPTFVMTCENDSGSTPQMSEAIAREIEGAKLVIVPRLQHLGLLEEPELFTKAVVGFLKQLG